MASPRLPVITALAKPKLLAEPHLYMYREGERIRRKNRCEAQTTVPVGDKDRTRSNEWVKNDENALSCSHPVKVPCLFVVPFAVVDTVKKSLTQLFENRSKDCRNKKKKNSVLDLIFLIFFPVAEWYCLVLA